MEKLVELSDREVQIDFKLDCKCRGNISIISLMTTTPIAFKVQTSSPHKFLVNPPAGLIVPPLSSATFTVILKPQSDPPSSFPRSHSDRFLIKTALAAEFVNSAESTSPDSINSWFSSSKGSGLVTYDLKLRVAYVGLFLLRHAISEGRTKAVKRILKRQKSVIAELSTRDAKSLYRVATKSANSDKVIPLLVEAGLKTQEVRLKLDNLDGCGGELKWVENGWSEIHLAATKGNLRCVKVLVEAGSDKKAKSRDGRTALYPAVKNINPLMVSLSTEMGADPTISTVELGRSALVVARFEGHKEMVEILERRASMLTAARRGDIKHLQLLLRTTGMGSSNHSDQYGLTSLHVAAIKGNKDVVRILIDHGIDLDCQDEEGHTPLHLAVESGSIETVVALVSAGANINTKSERGVTPLYMARAMGYVDISQFLLHKGAYSSPSPPSSSTSFCSSTM